MISYSSTQLEESYQELVKGNIKSSKRIFSHLMSENSLEVLDLAESVNDTICATRRGSLLNQSNTSLTSNTSSVSLFSATSATNDTNTSACSVSERGHIRTNRLKRRFNEAVEVREVFDWLRRIPSWWLCRLLIQQMVEQLPKRFSLIRCENILFELLIFPFTSSW